MKLLPLVGVLALAMGLLLLLPTAGSAIQFGLTGAQNGTWFGGVMGGATQAGSAIPRHVSAQDNWVVYRASVPLPPVLAPVLTAQVLPGGGVILPPLLIVSCPLPPDAGLAPFAPAGTVASMGAY